MTYNKHFTEALDELYNMMSRRGERHRASAYKKASESLMLYPHEITTLEEIKNVPNVGTGIMSKLEELVKTGKIETLEKERNNPINLLTKVYGIGDKNAKDFISKGITTIEHLKENEHLLTKNMKLGLKYFDDIEKRIPRSEIDQYNLVFNKLIPSELKYEIVGSYRRGNTTSGDIDIIITQNNVNNNDGSLFDKYIDNLISNDIVIEILSRGKKKCLAIAKLGNNPARRVDFLYSPSNEYPFAILYFTGSKGFNTAQRQRALEKGFTLNEHGFHYMKNGTKGEKVMHNFLSEKAIFNFLNMEYKEPDERIDVRSVVLKKNKTQKRKMFLVPTIVTKFRENGISALENVTEKELSELLEKANIYYHEKNSPFLTDDEFDILIEYTKKRFPENEVIVLGHKSVNVKKKTKLPFEMWSMDKIKPNTDILNRWIQKYNGPYVLSCKLDGVSGLYTKINGEQCLYTRGNGKIGQDITHIIEHLNLPSHEKNIVVRGEFIIKKDIFKKKYSTSANPRNFVAGLINSNIPDPNKLKDIDFVGYEVIEPQFEPSKQMDILLESGFKTVLNKTYQNVSNEMLSDILINWRTNSVYEIDGIICSDDKIYERKSENPKHAFAFKMVLSEQKVESKVIDVLWNPSKDGYLKPRIRIEPVTIGGVVVEYTSGFNAKYIKDNSIGVGTLVEMIRSGDVIPYITQIIKPSIKPLMPNVPYIWNDTNVDIILQEINDNNIVKEKNITGFFRALGVEGLSSGNVKRIIDAGFDSIPKIINMTVDEYIEIYGFSNTLATKISTNIQKQIQNATLPELMHATNILGRGFGVKKIKSILQVYPNVIKDTYNREELTKNIENISGMANKTAIKFVDNLQKFKIWLTETNLQNKAHYILESLPEPINVQHPLYNKKYVLSGFRDKSFINTLNSYGAIEQNVLTKNTDLLFVSDINTTSNKVELAKKYNVKIIEKNNIEF
tara:strand:- start:3212 stop:6085 length:2874 start_codon:yes stop_codon:yes gene_type:complete